MSENKRVTIPFLEKVLKPIVDLIRTKADKTDILQSDWNQTDETQKDFIKNKPFYSESTSLMKTASFTIGEDLAEQKIFENFIFIEDQIYSVSFGDKLYKCTAWKSSITGYYVIGNGHIYDGTDNGEDVPFACAANTYGDCYAFVKEPGSYSIIIASKEKIIQLDEKYIPNTIARAKDILEIDDTLSVEGAAADAKVVGDAIQSLDIPSDWNQNDSNAKDYIKNRPFYHNIKTWELTGISQAVSSTVIWLKDLYGLYNAEIDFDASKLYRVTMDIDVELDSENKIIHTFHCEMNSEVITYATYSLLNSTSTLNINGVDYTYQLQIVDASSNGNLILRLLSGGTQVFTGLRIQLDEILPIEECVIPDAIARTKNIPIVDSTLSIEGAAADAKTVGEKIIAPRPYITMVDQVSGHIYIVSIENGNLVSQAGVKQITVTTPPNLTEYVHGEYFDPTGMVVTATYSDDTTVDIVDYTYPTSFLKADVPPKISYTDSGVTYDAVIPITINAFDPSIVLIDFVYTDNKDGTYTLLEWKGTHNGEPSDKLVIPNYACIIV